MELHWNKSELRGKPTRMDDFPPFSYQLLLFLLSIILLPTFFFSSCPHPPLLSTLSLLVFVRLPHFTVRTISVSNAWIQSFPVGSYTVSHSVPLHFPSPLLFSPLFLLLVLNNSRKQTHTAFHHSRSPYIMLSVPLKQKPLTVNRGSSCPSAPEGPDWK